MGSMKDHVIDTLALVRYLENDLPPAADKVFKSAEQNQCKLLIPDIVMGEFVYLSMKGRLKTSDPKAFMMEVLISLEASRYFSIVGMDTVAWEEFLELDLPELHDRIIGSVALSNEAAIITNDKEIRKSKALETVWD